jgi:hypothetical protein
LGCWDQPFLRSLQEDVFLNRNGINVFCIATKRYPRCLFAIASTKMYF